MISSRRPRTLQPKPSTVSRTLGNARISRVALACAAVALLATASTALFFLLHHVGNQLPYDLAVQRFEAEAEAGRLDQGHAKGFKSRYEYCEISGAVIAGARRAGEADAESALRQAVILKRLRPEANSTRALCSKLEAAVMGSATRTDSLDTRYWWGGKALYAIALRYVSVGRIRELTQVATYVAYLLLAASLALLAPKMLLLAAPLLVFGAFFSRIEYWADVANGFPHLWTVLFAAVLALLIRAERGAPEGGNKVRTVPVFCFLGGTVSSYLWVGDGHTFLAVVWIGMVVWFGCAAADMAERTKRAGACIVLYGAGIVICYTLGQLVKAVFMGPVWWTFWRGVVRTVEDFWSPSERWTLAPDEMSVPAYLDSFYDMAWPGWLPADFVPTAVAVFSLTASLGFAIFEARRGRPNMLWGVLWIVGLISISAPTFLIGEHMHYRTARFVFVPLALCLSCLVLSMRTLEWIWRSLATVWELPALLIVAGVVSWYLASFEWNATARLIDSVRNMQPIASSVFDVYLDGNRLIYVKEQCSDKDENAPFFLHLYPVDVADLPAARQPHGFDNLDFHLRTIGRRDAGRCVVAPELPDYYGIASIETGQYLPGKGRVWSERVSFSVAKLIESVNDLRPVASSTFDVYLDGDRLVYVNVECGDEDDDAPFFLHLHPVDVADLPVARKPHGFDNLDFDFRAIGHRDARRCAAERMLPDYGVVFIGTGQHLPGKGPVWSVRVSLDL